MHTPSLGWAGNQLIDEIEAAQILAMSHRTLQAWRAKGEGPPFVRLGSAVRYRRAELESWLAARPRFGGPARK